jgi:hypothetical protein
LAHSLSVPFAVVIIAALMGVLGKYLWADIFQAVLGGPLWYQTIVSVIRGFMLSIELVVMPIAFVFIAIFWAIVFHFLGSIVAGSDITKSGTFYKTMKLTGFIYAPLFLNILPLFPLITGYWSARIAYFAMRENYKTTNSGAFIIILPYLFTVVWGTVAFLLGFLR